MYVRAMNLADYMQAEGLDDAAMGAIISRSRVSVGRYRRGLEVIPSEIVKQLVEISDGRMTANDLLGISQSEAAE